MWHRIGVVDMAMDLDESRGKSREYLPGGSSPALSLAGDSTRGILRTVINFNIQMLPIHSSKMPEVNILTDTYVLCPQPLMLYLI